MNILYLHTLHTYIHNIINQKIEMCVRSFNSPIKPDVVVSGLDDFHPTKSSSSAKSSSSFLPAASAISTQDSAKPTSSATQNSDLVSPRQGGPRQYHGNQFHSTATAIIIVCKLL